MGLGDQEGLRSLRGGLGVQEGSLGGSLGIWEVVAVKERGLGSGCGMVLGSEGGLASRRGLRGLEGFGSHGGGLVLSTNPQHVCNNPKYFFFYT